MNILKITKIIYKLTDDFGTFPRKVIFLLAFSFAIRIRCLGAISNVQLIYSSLPRIQNTDRSTSIVH